jgi:signal transduction histidine kinase
VGDDESARLRLETISAQIERIERIVREMMDRTRPSSPQLAPVDLNALLARIFDATAPALDARRVQLLTELAESLPQIRGDADRLQQVFINLINNALDAMPEGGQLTVRTGAIGSEETNPDAASKSAAFVFVEFADTGIGMTEELRSRIFDPFYTTKATGHGTGLGLVVVRQVMREHGGDIEVESERGKGTRFRLKLPVAAVEEQKPDALLEVSRAGN